MFVQSSRSRNTLQFGRAGGRFNGYTPWRGYAKREAMMSELTRKLLDVLHHILYMHANQFTFRAVVCGGS